MTRSTILDAVHESARDLHEAGLISDAEMAEYDAYRPTPETFSPADIQRIRDANGLAQSGLAFYLNVSTSTVQKWEQGKKKPSGPARKLLDLLDRKGLAALS